MPSGVLAITVGKSFNLSAKAWKIKVGSFLYMSAVLRITCFVVSFHCLIGGTAPAQKAIDELITSYASTHHVPALSVAVVDNGQLLSAKGYGIADVENDVRRPPVRGR